MNELEALRIVFDDAIELEKVTRNGDITYNAEERLGVSLANAKPLVDTGDQELSNKELRAELQHRISKFTNAWLELVSEIDGLEYGKIFDEYLKSDKVITDIKQFIIDHS